MILVYVPYVVLKNVSRYLICPLPPDGLFIDKTVDLIMESVWEKMLCRNMTCVGDGAICLT